MLNEIGEYEQYILSPEEIATCKNRRLKHYTLIKKDSGGLERVMTIIARHFIFDTPVGSNEDELREILKAWCGFNHEAKTDLPEHFDGWLNRYIHILLFEKIQSCLDNEKFPNELKSVIKTILSDQNFGVKEFLAVLKDFNSIYGDVPSKIKDAIRQIKNLLEALDELPNKNRTFSRNLFDNDKYRAITYDKVIANAFLAGKLRRYYLACDEDLFETNRILKTDGKKFSAKDKDMVLKMTAEYFLQSRNTTQEFIVTNNADMTNWLLGAVKSEELSKKRKIYMLTETNEEIFETSTIAGINVIKVKLNPEWAKHFRLIEDGSTDLDAKWGRIFFSDTGSSEFLKELILP